MIILQTDGERQGNQSMLSTGLKPMIWNFNGGNDWEGGRERE